MYTCYTLCYSQNHSYALITGYTRSYNNNMKYWFMLSYTHLLKNNWFSNSSTVTYEKNLYWLHGKYSVTVSIIQKVSLYPSASGYWLIVIQSKGIIHVCKSFTAVLYHNNWTCWHRIDKKLSSGRKKIITLSYFAFVKLINVIKWLCGVCWKLSFHALPFKLQPLCH